MRQLGAIGIHRVFRVRIEGKGRKWNLGILIIIRQVKPAGFGGTHNGSGSPTDRIVPMH